MNLFFKKLIFYYNILSLQEDIHVWIAHQLSMTVCSRGHTFVKLVLGMIILWLWKDQTDFTSILQMQVLRIVSRVI